MSESKPNSRKIITIILGIGLAGLILATCLYITYLLVIMGLAQSRARSLAPPPYPNSEVIESWQSGGSETMWDRRTYRTSDSIDQVLVFMEEYMPGFQIRENSQGQTTYYNYADDTSWLGRQAAEIACTTLFCIEKEVLSYPGVSVTIYSDPANPTNTLFQIWISWPAL